MNRPYEMMYIVNSRLDEDTQKAITQKIEDTIAKMGGTLDKTELVGRKRLAYPIQKQNDGIYMMTHFSADSRSLKELTRVMNITEGLLRHLVIRKDDN